MHTKDVYELLARVRARGPLVHHITNWVTIYDCANIVKVFGASPVMAHAVEEVADMVSLASALVLNIGTLTKEIIAAMKLAGGAANKKGIPVVLDVCGAGATPFRDSMCAELLDSVQIAVIKGNSSEVARVAGENVQTKGVDAVHVEKNLIHVAGELAGKRTCTVVITGKEDIIADHRGDVYKVNNGHEMMAGIVGTGCMAASVIGAFAAVEPDTARAAAAGLCCYEIAAEFAAEDAMGPGSFKELLFDRVHALDQTAIEKNMRIT
jgi:hydroxyethylthiazole kinase